MTIINEHPKNATSIYGTITPAQFYERLVRMPEYYHIKQNWLFPLDSKLTINGNDYWMFIGGKPALAFDEGIKALKQRHTTWDNCTNIRINEFMREIDILCA